MFYEIVTHTIFTLETKRLFYQYTVPTTVYCRLVKLCFLNSDKRLKFSWQPQAQYTSGTDSCSKLPLHHDLI